MEIQKFEYLENEKILLDEIESVFNNFQGLSFGEKKNKQQTQAFTLS